MLALVNSLTTMVSEINRLQAEIADTLTAHPDGPVFRSFFASSTSVLCPATLLAEIGDARARYPHRDAISAQAGCSPVARAARNREVVLLPGVAAFLTARPPVGSRALRV